MSSDSFSLDKTVPVFDGSNFLEWSAQMKGYLQLKGWGRIVDGTITRPAAQGADQTAWDNADEMALGCITLKLAHNMRTGMVGATSALTWTALQTTFARSSVSAVYQDFKAAIRMKVGTSNPAKDITKLFTHLERLKANGVTIPDYVQGMMLLNAIPDDWDHVAAYYVQTTTAIANVSFTAIRTAILAEHDRLGGTRQNQSHIADKISAVKRKGQSPRFSNQSRANHEPASSEAGPSNPNKKKRGARGKGKGKQPQSQQGSHHHSHLASRLEMSAELNSRPLLERFLELEAQPAFELNRALGSEAAKLQQQTVNRPSNIRQIPLSVTSTTIASFDPAGIKQLKLPVKKSAAAYTGQPSMPGPATLPEAHKLAERLSVRRNRENLKALEALREHRKFVETSRAYADAVAAERPPSPPSNTSGIVEIPDHINHMPPPAIAQKARSCW